MGYGIWRKVCKFCTYPDSRLSEVGPHGNFFPRAHVGVPVPGKSGLELLELLRGEVSPLSPLSLLVLGVLVTYSVLEVRARVPADHSALVIVTLTVVVSWRVDF